MRASTVAALGATAWLWADPAGFGALGLPLLGLAFAVMFPVVIGLTPAYVGEDRAARSVGYQIGASALGFTIVPAVIGVVADTHGVAWAAPILLAAVALCGVLWLSIEVAAGHRSSFTSAR